MNVIYKEAIPFVDAFVIRYPVPFDVLKIGVQLNRPFIWVRLLDIPPKEEVPGAKIYERHFRLEGTGVKFEQPPGAGLLYIDSFIIEPTGFVGHVFENVGGSNEISDSRKP